MVQNTETGLTVTNEFQRALELLDSGSHLFLTGKAGTGKSTLIRMFTEAAAKKVVVAAPTGVAALNVQGYTLHRLFSFGPGVTPEYVASDDYYPGRFARTLRALDTLIIDEASMVRADLFDSIAIALRRFGPKPGTLFGGVQIVLVGDLYQLPPVVTEGEQEYFSTVYSSPFFFAAHSYDGQHFPTIELTTVFRQIGDPGFVKILNAIRDGQTSPQIVDELNAHVQENFVPNNQEFWLTLTTLNRIADARNRKQLATLKTEQWTSQAQLTGDLDGFDMPTQETLDFKIGAQIMLLTNDPQNRWVNGSLAVITHIARPDQEFLVEIQLRNGVRHILTEHTWEITRPNIAGGTLSHEVIGTFRQLPFRLAWAVTIHKAQGLTLERCIIDLSGGTFADGQLYVALSRARSLDGLVLARDVRPRDLRVNQHIRHFHHTHDGGEQGEPVVITANFVGDDGIQWRPRPIELAVILPDGTELTTVVDPQRDIGDAATQLGISAQDVVLAPTLPLAWAKIAPHLAGRIPVGYNLVSTLEYIDYELKRHGHIIQLPIGIDLKTEGSRRTQKLLQQATTALEKARILKETLDKRSHALPAATTFDPIEPGFGYLMHRHTGNSTDFVLAPEDTEHFTQYMGTLITEAQNSPRLLATLQAIATETGHSIPALHTTAKRSEILDILQPGSTLCFTGQAINPENGDQISRADLEALAVEKGLQTEPNLTKSRTDALIVAEFGTQSGKAKNARKWGKPIFSVEEFLNWANGKHQPITQTNNVAAKVNINYLDSPHPKGATAQQGEPVQSVHISTRTSHTLTERKPGSTPAPSQASPLEIPWTTESIDEFLTKDATISLTGTIYHPTDGHRITHEEFATTLTHWDMQYLKNVSQSQTTVLLIGEIRKITRQITTAIQAGIPIFRATDFFDWIERHTKPAVHPEMPLSEPAPTMKEHQVEPTYATPSRAAARPQKILEDDKNLPVWTRLPTGKFYSLLAGIPVTLLLIVPIIIMIPGILIPSIEAFVTGLAAIVMLLGAVSVPVLLVLTGSRIRGRRRWVQTQATSRS